MSIRMSSDEKYRDLREQMEEAARVVAKWPSWMIDQAQRRKLYASQQGDDVETTSTASPQPAHTR
jgi:hypothetical protein